MRHSFLTFGFLIVFSAIILGSFSACNKDENIYHILYNGKKTCEKIAYQAKIGTDLKTALDSLVNLNIPLIDNRGYYIKKETLEVDFHKDNRTFYKIRFIDANFPYGDSYEADLLMPDVLDSYGNYYRIRSCPD